MNIRDPGGMPVVKFLRLQELTVDSQSLSLSKSIICLQNDFPFEVLGA